MRSASPSAVASRPGRRWCERGLDLGVAERRQALAGRRPAGIAARLLSGSPPCFFRCACDQRLDRGAVRRRRGAAVGQEVGQGSRAWRPDAEGGDELVAGHHPVLQRQQAEEQIAWGIARWAIGAAPGARRRAKRRARTRWRIWGAEHGAEGDFAHHKEIIGRDGSEWGVRVSTTAWGVPASQGRVRDLAPEARY